MIQKQVVTIIENRLKCKAIWTESDTYIIDASDEPGYILFDIGYDKSSYIIRDKQGYFNNKDIEQILKLI